MSRREQMCIELRGEGYAMVRQWKPENCEELNALKDPGIDHRGQHYRYVGTQDYCAVFVLER